MPATKSALLAFQSTPSQRGRLFSKRSYRLKLSISIHALAKRATYDLLTPKEIRSISIHALAKRATIDLANVKNYSPISIHALAKRATLLSQTLSMLIIFQSTPSQRGRHRAIERTVQGGYFNPRPRKEGDS